MNTKLRPSLVQRFDETCTLTRKESPIFFGTPAILWIAIFLYIPVLFMIGTSFFQIDPVTQSTVASLGNYQKIFSGTYFNVIFYSIVIAFLNTLFCLMIGYPIAYYLSIKTRHYKTFFLFLLIVPFWVNFLVHVYAWFFLLEKHGFINRLLLWLGIIDTPLHLLNSPFAVLIGMIYCYIPFMVLPIYSQLERFDRRWIEASLDLGASSWKTFWRVTFPLTRSGWISGILLVFIPSCAEFAIPSLMGGDRMIFLGSIISHLILSPNTLGEGTAFTTVASFSIFCSLVGLLYGINALLKNKAVPLEELKSRL